VRFGDSDQQRSRAVAVDAWGNTIIVGDFRGTVDFGGGVLTDAGNNDIFVAKLDPDGAHIWSNRFGDGSTDNAHAVAVDAAGNIFVTGRFMGQLDLGGGPLINGGGYDAYFVKFSPDCAYLWGRVPVSPDYQSGTAVAVDASGNGIFAWDRQAGNFAGMYDTIVNKYDPDGTVLSIGIYGASDYQYTEGLAVDSSENVFMTGSFAGTACFGCDSLVCAGPMDVYVAKIEPDNSCIWSSRFGDAGDQRAEAIAVDAAGNVIITGYFSSSVDFGGGALSSAGDKAVFIAKFSPDGAHRWSKGIGDGNMCAQAVAVDVSGNVIVAGFFDGSVDFGGGPLTSAGGSDIFLAKLGTDGAHVWSKRFGDGSDQYANSVAVDASGNVIVTGRFMGTVDFGGGPLTSAGGMDIFVAKFKP
jgi:hypothetical protein